MTRVLRISHSGVVAEYRQRERVLQREHGYEMHLLCPDAWEEGGVVVPAEPDAEIAMSVARRRGRKTHPQMYWFETSVLRETLRRVRPHLIDVHQEPYSLAMAHALTFIQRDAPDVPVCVYTAQNIHKAFAPPFAQLERRALNASTAAYPCSTEAAEVLRAKGFQGEIHVLPLGVSLQPDRTVVDGGVLKVGFVGRLESYKGTDIALRAFASAEPSGRARMEFLGSGPELEPLRRAARDLGLVGRVDFPGSVSQDEALERIAGYDVILIPSLTTPAWKEQFGRVAAQALAAGTAVIASDSGSLREVVGDAGVLVPEGNVSALALALNELLESPERRRELAHLGQSRAAERFSWARIAEGVDRMYRQALG